MICGSAWVLITSPCTSEENPNRSRPSSMNTSPSLEPHSHAPTRSLWMRGRCSLRLHWWELIWGLVHIQRWTCTNTNQSCFCLCRSGRSPRSWGHTLTWWWRNVAASCLCPVSPVHGSGDHHKPVRILGSSNKRQQKPQSPVSDSWSW